MSGWWIVMRSDFSAKIDRRAFRDDEARKTHGGFDPREQRLGDARRTGGGIVRRPTIVLGTDRGTGGHAHAGGDDEMLPGAVPYLDQRCEQHQQLREDRQQGQSLTDCPMQVTPHTDIHSGQG